MSDIRSIITCQLRYIVHYQTHCQFNFATESRNLGFAKVVQHAYRFLIFRGLDKQKSQRSNAGCKEFLYAPLTVVKCPFTLSWSIHQEWPMY